MAPKRSRSTRKSTKMARVSTQGKQELLPGIPDELTMKDIAKKFDWRTFMVLQMVSRAWRHEICSRNVYNDRMLSKTNKAFLVLVYSTAWYNAELLFSLFSCEDGFIRQLPSIPDVKIMGNADIEAFDCVCLDGKIYAWVSAYPSNATWRKTYVLDLAAGDGKWSVLGRNKKCTHRNDFGHGVLDGKIYRFRGDTHAGLGVLDTTGHLRRMTIEEKVLDRPQTEVYDPDADVWSRITPEPLLKTTGRKTDLKRYLLKADISKADPLEHHLASFSKWAQEQLNMDASKTFLTNGRYEPFFSEWRRNRSTDGSMSSAGDGHSKKDVATQVYYLNRKVLRPTHPFCDEILIFFQGHLLKHISAYTSLHAPVFDIQIYDTQTSTWKHWKSFSFNIRPRNQYQPSYRVVELASVDNTIWALVRVSFVNPLGDGLFYLVRSPELLSENHEESIGWIDTGCFFPILTSCQKLRPIYF